MKKRRLLIELLIIALLVVWLMPLFLLVMNSIKSGAEIDISFLSIPKSIKWGNFIKAWEITRYPSSFLNSLIVTAVSVFFVTLFSSMTAYKLARTKTRLSGILFFILIFGMMVPFPTLMIPIVKQAANLKLYSKLIGMIAFYLGLNGAFVIFLVHGFIKSVPMDIEEAAVIDGSGPFRMFFQIVLPLLKPIISSVMVLEFIWIWNDFMMPMLLLRRKASYTLPVTMFALWGDFQALWGVIFASVLIIVLPSVLFFFVMQKHIIKGVSAGSVKG